MFKSRAYNATFETLCFTNEIMPNAQLNIYFNFLWLKRSQECFTFIGVNLIDTYERKTFLASFKP